MTVPLALVVLAGAAGTGKTTLGRALARRLGGALLDLDTVTGPLTEALLECAAGDPLGYDTPFARDVARGLRYRTLTATALDVVGCGSAAVAAAPWTRELRDPGWYRDLAERVRGLDARLAVVHLRCDERVRQDRLAARGLARDRGRASAADPDAPAVPHLALDTTEPGQLAAAGRISAVVELLG